MYEGKSSRINYSVNIIMSCTRNLTRAPSHWVGSTAGASRHPRLGTVPNHGFDCGVGPLVAPWLLVTDALRSSLMVVGFVP